MNLQDVEYLRSWQRYANYPNHRGLFEEGKRLILHLMSPPDHYPAISSILRQAGARNLASVSRANLPYVVAQLRALL